MTSDQPVPSRQQRATFVELSAVLTGFEIIELEGTGLVDAHCELIAEIVGADFFARFISAAEEVVEQRDNCDRDAAVDLLASSVLGPLASNLISLWYLGQWDAISDDWFARNDITLTSANASHIPPGAYEEALSYRAADTHAPGAKPPGHGSWSAPPLSVSESALPAKATERT